MASVRAGPASFLALALATLATLMLQILITRIFSVTLWYHFAFMAVSIAMFGLTFGATLVYVRPGRFPPDRTHALMAVYALAFSIATVVCFLAHLYLPFLTGTGSIAPRVGTERGTLGATVLYLGLTYAIVAVPFVFSGVVVCLALTRFPAQLPRLYAADLAGSALGCLLVVLLLRAIDAPTAVFAVAACAAAAALLFARDAGGAARLERASLATLGVLLAAIAALAVSGRDGSPVLRPPFVKGERAGDVLWERWSSYAHVSVFGDPNLTVPAAGWGFSERKRSRPQNQLGVEIDASAGTIMTRYRGDPAAVVHLAYDITNLAHHLRHDADVLVVGVGGGRDILAALHFGQRSVTGVEINGDLLYALNQRFGDFSGHLDRDPRVSFVNDEARSWVSRHDRRIDVLQVSLIDTWAATAAGAFVLTENGLYTTDAWRGFLARLAPDGLLSFSRFYVPQQPAETQRLVALAAAALRESGASEPLRHLALVTNLPPGSPRKSGVATLLASPTPLSEADLARLQEVASEQRFTILLSPTAAADPRLAVVAASEGRRGGDARLDLSPPTDDRPFFFHTLRLASAFDGPQIDSAHDVNARAVRVLVALLAIVIALTLLFLLLPVAWTARSIPRGASTWLVYFAAIGFGFMCVEISQIQRLIVFLGHPIYGLTVLLFALLLASGIGSALVPQIESVAQARAQLWRLGVLLAVLIAFGTATPPVIETVRGQATAVRIAVAVALIGPLGLFLGMAFPLGMGAASLGHAPITPWLWGVNGATSVCASVAALAIALSYGISGALWTGAACYAIAIAALARALHREPPGSP
jgi:hypothetical protein